MITSDPGPLQWIAFISAITVIALLIYMTLSIRYVTTAWVDRQRSVTDTALANVQQEAYKVKQIEIKYQLALLERAGSIEPVSLTIPQSEIDRLALEQLKIRIHNMKVKQR